MPAVGCIERRQAEHCRHGFCWMWQKWRHLPYLRWQGSWGYCKCCCSYQKEVWDIKSEYLGQEHGSFIGYNVCILQSIKCNKSYPRYSLQISEAGSVQHCKTQQTINPSLSNKLCAVPGRAKTNIANGYKSVCIRLPDASKLAKPSRTLHGEQ